MISNDKLKDTLLGAIPADWEMVPLGNVFEAANNKLKDNSNGNQDIPILSMTRSDGLVLQSQKFEKRVASRDTSNYKIVKHGELVYGFPIDEGVIAILHRYPIGAVSPAYQVWKPIHEFDPTFIDYMLKIPAMMNIYNMYSSNVVERRRNLSPKDFVRIEIPLPPLPEQRAIARVLNTARKSIEATERVIKAVRELKRSLMKYLFTYGPVPIDQADQVLLKETEIGEVPIGWNITQLSKVASFTTKPRYLDLSLKKHIPFVPMDAIPEEGFFQEYFIMKAPHEISSGVYAELGDILLAKITPSFENGKQAILTNIPLNFAYVTTEVYPLHPKNDSLLNQLFLFHYLRLPKVRFNIASKMEGTTGRQRVPKAIVQNTYLPIPCLSEQMEIIRQFNILEDKLRIEIQRKTTLEALFTSLLHHLMTGKIRVPISET